MKICEIYKSIIGEGGFAGFPAVIVRTSGCNLRCKWCDTKYAYDEGEEIKLETIARKIKSFNPKFVLLTGGEPLMQAEAIALSHLLANEGYILIVETNGSLDISSLPEYSVRIVDIKPPGSGMSSEMDWKNIDRLRKSDEVKFVITDRTDYLWARKIAVKYKLFDRITSVFLSPVYSYLKPEKLVKWILKDTLPFRLNLQLHKIIWGERRGV